MFGTSSEMSYSKNIKSSECVNQYTAHLQNTVMCVDNMWAKRSSHRVIIKIRKAYSMINFIMTYVPTTSTNFGEGSKNLYRAAQFFGTCSKNTGEGVVNARCWMNLIRIYRY